MIGLSGPNGTGKTTLADAFARKQNVPFVATSASAVFAKMGLDPKADYPFETRMQIQEMLLGVFASQYETAARKSSIYVTDRTPVDLASYLLADVQRGTMAGNARAIKATMHYVESCLEVTALYFSAVVLVQPGIVVAERPGKAPQCPAYMMHLNTLQLGLMCDERIRGNARVIPRATIDLGARVDILTHIASNFMPVSKEVVH